MSCRRSVCHALILCCALATGLARAEIHPFRLTGQAGEGLLFGNEPAVFSGGSGGEFGPGITFDDLSDTLTVSVAWGSGIGFQNLTGNATAANIHGPTSAAYPNNLTQTAGVQVNLGATPFTFNTSASAGSITGTSLPLNASQKADLLAGRLYINVHTAANGGGEIRGFLVPELLVTTANDFQTGSLRSMVDLAQSLFGPNTIPFAEGLANQDVFAQSDLHIPSPSDFSGVTLATAVGAGAVNIGVTGGILTLRQGFAWTGTGKLALGQAFGPAATVIFANQNNLTFTPVVQVRAGGNARTLRVENSSGIHTFGSSLDLQANLTLENVSGGTVRLTAPLDLGANQLTVRTQSAPDIVEITGTLTRNIPGGFGIVQAGPGTLKLSGTFSSANTLSAQVQGGTLELSSPNGAILGALPEALRVDDGGIATLTLPDQIDNAAAVLIDGELRLQADETLDRLEGTGGRVTAPGIPATLTVGANGGTSQFSGLLEGNLSLVKTGSGTQTLSGDSLAAGTVSVQGGILNVMGTHHNAGLATIQSGTLAGTGWLRDLRLEAVGILSPGDQGVGVGTLSGQNLTWSAGGTLKLQLGAISDQINLSGSLTKDATGSYTIDFQGTGAPRQTYVLASFASTTFSASDFTATNLAPGRSGTFAIVNGTSLTFTTDDPLVVTSASDSGDGTLRAAVALAAGLPGADTITFAPALNGDELAVTSSEMVLNDPDGVTIDASGLPAGVTLLASGGTRIFSIPAGRTVTLRNLTLAGGGGVGAARNNDGGAVLNQGTLNLTRCAFTGNFGSGSGGALANISSTPAAAVVNARYCTFTNNAGAGGGGAIANWSFNNVGPRATLNLTGCTFTGNLGSTRGGAVLVFSAQGISEAVVEACTFTGGNQAAEGGALHLRATAGTASAQVNSSTVVGNNGVDSGGGFAFSAAGSGQTPLRLENTILAGNTAPTGPNLQGFLTSGGHNFIGNHSGMTFGPNTGDQVGTPAAPLDPRLGSLAHNGGPTQTMLPLPGSPVIDTGASTSARDQRLLPRSVDGDGVGGGAADIGAVEFNPDRDARPLVGFNFHAASPGLLGAADRAGYPPYAQINWNNLTSDNAGATTGAYTQGPTPLLAPLGTAFAPNLRLWWDSPNVWAIGGTPTTPDQRLMYGYLDSIGTANGGGNDLNQIAVQPFFSVADLPAEDVVGGYDVVVYVDGDAVVGRIGEYWITSNRGASPANVYGELELTSHRFVRDNANFSGAYTLLPATATTAATAADANVVVLPDVTETAFTLRTEETNFRAPINAVQLVQNPTLVVTTALDELDPEGPEGDGLSLREALRDLPEGGGVVFAAALSGAEIQLTRGELPLPRGAVIDASDLPGGLSLSAVNSRHFTVPAGRSLHLLGLTLRGGNGTGYDANFQNGGGAVACGGDLRLTRCTLVNNTAVHAGGALWVTGGSASAILEQCNVALNQTVNPNGFGGSLAVSLGGLQLVHTTVSMNSSAGGPGGLFMDIFGKAIIANSIVSGNFFGISPSDVHGFDLSSLTFREANAVDVMTSLGSTTGPTPIPGDPLLGFGNFGGGRDSFHPFTGSPARNNGVATAGTPRLDSRGLPRVLGGVPDLGAVEEVATYTAPYAANGSWNVYLVGPAFLTWAEAEAYARSLTWEGKTGHLVAIQSAEENEFVRQIAGRTFCWIGLTDNEGFGGAEADTNPNTGWTWVGGENGAYRNWASGEPNDVGQKDAVGMYDYGSWFTAGMGANGQFENRYRSTVIEFEVRNPHSPFEEPTLAIQGTIGAQPFLPPFPLRQECGGAEGMFLGAQFASLPVPPRHLTEAGRVLADVAGGGGIRTDGAVPVVNLTDLQNPGVVGLFPNDASFPLNNALDDDHFATYFRAHLRVTPDLAGTWTFQLRGNEGCALRIPGLFWQLASGNGLADPGDPSTLVFPETTADAAVFGVIDLPAGDYEVEFVSFEGTGGASAEVSAGRGVYPVDGEYKLLGDPAGLPVTGVPAYLSFNGTSDYLEIGGAGVALGNTFTQEAWIFPQHTDASFHGFLGNQPAGGIAVRAPSLWVFDQRKLHGGFGTGSAWSAWATGDVLTTNAWNHVAVSHDGTTTRVYVNGSEVLAFTPSGPSANTPVKWIGKVDNFFKGRMDEVRLWTVTRTQAQIRADMHRVLAGKEPGLAAYWRMDSCTGTTPPSIGPAHTTTAFGTLPNGASWIPAPAPTGLFNPQVQPAGNSTFDFFGTPGATFRVLAADNPALPIHQWTNLGPATGNGFGLYSFSDPAAATLPRRYYRVQSE